MFYMICKWQVVACEILCIVFSVAQVHSNFSCCFWKWFSGIFRAQLAPSLLLHSIRLCTELHMFFSFSLSIASIYSIVRACDLTGLIGRFRRHRSTLVPLANLESCQESRCRRWHGRSYMKYQRIHLFWRIWVLPAQFDCTWARSWGHIPLLWNTQWKMTRSHTGDNLAGFDTESAMIFVLLNSLWAIYLLRRWCKECWNGHWLEIWNVPLWLPRCWSERILRMISCFCEKYVILGKFVRRGATQPESPLFSFNSSVFSFNVWWERGTCTVAVDSISWDLNPLIFTP